MIALQRPHLPRRNPLRLLHHRLKRQQIPKLQHAHYLRLRRLLKCLHRRLLRRLRLPPPLSPRLLLLLPAKHRQPLRHLRHQCLQVTARHTVHLMLRRCIQQSQANRHISPPIILLTFHQTNQQTALPHSHLKTQRRRHQLSQQTTQQSHHSRLHHQLHLQQLNLRCHWRHQRAR